VRWARVTGGAGAGLRVTADPVANISVHRWTVADLDAAQAWAA
jgi:hypothetical protein